VVGHGIEGWIDNQQPPDLVELILKRVEVIHVKEDVKDESYHLLHWRATTARGPIILAGIFQKPRLVLLTKDFVCPQGKARQRQLDEGQVPLGPFMGFFLHAHSPAAGGIQRIYTEAKGEVGVFG